MSTFNNNKGNNTNNTTNTKKARAAAGTSAKKVFHRPTAKQVEKMAESRVKKGEIKLPPVKILYLAKASDAERESALKAFIACAGSSTPPTPPASPVTPVNPVSPNGPPNISIGKLMVPTILLAIDVGYHRDPRIYCGNDKQEHITEKYDQNEMEPLKVTFRDNILWVVDGGRRLLAAIERGKTEVEIQLVDENWSREKEAEVYRDQNKYRIQVSAYQQFIASLVAKNPTARLLVAVCEQYGLRVCDKASDFDRPLKAVGTALKIMDGTFGKRSGKYTFSWMLSIMENCNWFNDRTFLREAVSVVFLNAFAAVMVEADKAGKITGYTNKLENTLVQLSPQLVRAYGRVQYPLMSAQGSTTTILKEIGRGTVKATDILKVVANP